MIRLLGRQTSGNVQKVIFCLEELGVPYIREDYGRQFGNTRHCARLDREALPGASDRASGVFGAPALADCDRSTAGLCGGNRRQAKRIDTGGIRVGDVKRLCHQINTAGLTHFHNQYMDDARST